MPAIRIPARSTVSTCHDVGYLHPYESILETENSSYTCDSQFTSAEPIVPVNKKRRAPNAFFLFRSYFIANRLHPPEIIHQSEVSRYISVVWRNMTAEERNVFFKMAEAEKRRFEIEGPPEIKKKVRVRARKHRTSKRGVNLDQPLELLQGPASPSSTSTSSSDFESASSDLFLSSSSFITQFSDDDWLASPMTALQPPDSAYPIQYDWNLQPSSPVSSQFDPIYYSPECIQDSPHPTALPVCDTISDTDGGSLDYELLFNLDFLLSTEMTLLSPIDGYNDFASPAVQMTSFDSWNFPIAFL